jgi:hypothetical protein
MQMKLLKKEINVRGNSMFKEEGVLVTAPKLAQRYCQHKSNGYYCLYKGAETTRSWLL